MEVRKPRKWKMALLTWMVIYPLLNILFALLMPVIGHLHNLVRTLIMTVILVPVMGAVIGLLQKKYAEWLYK